MGTYRFGVHANLAPTETLFLWTDLDRVTEWMRGVRRVTDVAGRPDRPDFTLPGQKTPLVIAPGSRYTLWFRLGPVRHEVLPVDDPASTTAHRTRLEGTFRRGEMLVTFEPEGGGSRVTLDVQTDGLLPGIAGRVLAAGSFPGGFRSQLRSFARFAERERLSKLLI